ncbi:hypothetical protein [Nocardiopsis sp. HUAS JQ3]|uniref:hypothetical protein n=1 Tax=Nocardiopsis sp. HUAS JQ3 TaxID=3061629 RepID=UPI0023A9B1B2|nr:hypothetical protein [Nocardiopsis sp. HUAS JQ3]WDZ91483.1 hypothetical protein PV789_02610 [Nocardiopsis sp. HUAS JQ3]
MTPTTLDPLSEAASLLTPQSVSRFLASHGWELEGRQPGIREIWRLDQSPEYGSARVMLPLATDFVDFQARFKDTIESLCHVYMTDAVELRERVTATHSDIFLVRLNQPMSDGSIPFRQAGSTVDSLFRMLKAAATTAADPLHSHRGRRPAIVADFLDESIRLGQTKQGSFVFTVSAFLGDQPPEDRESGGSADPPAFARLVMATLARGLESARRLALHWDERVLDSPSDLGLSAALVESMEEMTRPDKLRSVDLSFQWAAAKAPPDVAESTIVLDRDVIVELPRLRERLVRREEPSRRITLIGIVKGLAREETPPGEEEAADITLLTEVSGKTRNVQVSLEGEDHRWAIIAYQRNLPLVVTGDLSFERRTWRLSGDIDVDASFLRHFSRTHPSSGGDERNT